MLRPEYHNICGRPANFGSTSMVKKISTTRILPKLLYNADVINRQQQERSRSKEFDKNIHANISI